MLRPPDGDRQEERCRRQERGGAAERINRRETDRDVRRQTVRSADARTFGDRPVVSVRSPLGATSFVEIDAGVDVAEADAASVIRQVDDRVIS